MWLLGRSALGDLEVNLDKCFPTLVLRKHCPAGFLCQPVSTRPQDLQKPDNGNHQNQIVVFEQGRVKKNAGQFSLWTRVGRLILNNWTVKAKVIGETGKKECHLECGK